MSICIKTPVKRLETPREMPSENEYLYNNGPSLLPKTTIKNLKKPNVWPNISKKILLLFS